VRTDGPLSRWRLLRAEPPSTRELYVKSIDEELDEVRQGGGKPKILKKCWQLSLEPK
jgi:hypothetical protein